MERRLATFQVSLRRFHKSVGQSCRFAHFWLATAGMLPVTVKTTMLLRSIPISAAAATLVRSTASPTSVRTSGRPSTTRFSTAGWSSRQGKNGPGSFSATPDAKTCQNLFYARHLNRYLRSRARFVDPLQLARDGRDTRVMSARCPKARRFARRSWKPDRRWRVFAAAASSV